MICSNRYRIYVVKYILFLVCFCALSPSILAQNPQEQKWVGKISENGVKYDYALSVMIDQGKINGTSNSKGPGFNCIASFSGQIKDERVLLTETKVLSTNYSDKNKICLMSLNLRVFNDSLVGSFVSSSKHKSTCGSGEVKLRRLNSPRSIMDTTHSTRSSHVESIIPASTKEEKSVLVTGSLPVNGRRISNRKVDLSDVFEVPYDSVRLEIFDNGMIDGDIISVYINNEKFVSNVRLTDKPVSIDFVKKRKADYVVEFFAENLGTIPPNTGLLVLKNGSFRKEVNFDSDFEKTHAIKIFLKQ